MFFISFLILCLVVAWAKQLRGGCTLYLFQGHGYRAIPLSESPPQKLTLEQFSKTLERLLAGGVFDSLWVSGRPNKYGGLVVNLRSETPVLVVSFSTVDQQGRIAAFKEMMESFGKLTREDSSRGKGGVQVTGLTFALPYSQSAVKQAVDAGLSNLREPPNGTYYVTAWRSADHVRPGWRFRLINHRDFLKGIAGALPPS